MIVPDLIEPVIGWRQWTLIPHTPTEPRLAPFGGELSGWPAGVATVAVCPRDLPVEPHDPPGVGCACGLYAHKTIEQLWAGHAPRLGDGDWAWGTVALWGRVLEYETGYRAEYGYPQHLWTENPAAADLLRSRYLIPVSPLAELMETGSPEAPGRPRFTPPPDRTGGRGPGYYDLVAPRPVPQTDNTGAPYVGPRYTPNWGWPFDAVMAVIRGLPRGSWQAAICVGIFEPDGCQPHRWMDPRGACTSLRIRSLSDILARLAGRGVTVKRIPGRWGGEFGSTYRVTAMGPDPVAAPKPRTRGYRVEPQR